MLYLLDASVLITAHNSYYPVGRIPEFWEWLQYMAAAGCIKMPLENYEEITDGPKGNDILYKWLHDPLNEDSLVLKEVVDAGAVDYVVNAGYAPDLTDDEIEQLGRDPFLIAYGLVQTNDRSVVTVEVSKPSKKRSNRHIPDVCKSVGVHSCDPFTMYRDLGFGTGWKLLT